MGTPNGIWNPNEQYDLDPTTGQYTKKAPDQLVPAGSSPFDSSQVPSGVPNEWAEDFIRRNPGDYSRIGSAYQSDIDAKQQYATPTQQWNAQPAAQPQSDALYQMLMQRAQQGTAVNRNDPNIRSQVDPVVAQQERASRNYLDDVAERSGPLANLQGERRLVAERGGQAAGAFESEVIGREIAAKRDEIQQALSLYGSMLSADKQLELQNQLAQLNAALQREGYGLQREGMAQSNDQFLRELALREWIAGDNSAQGWAGFGA
jgi:hypothetical protein